MTEQELEALKARAEAHLEAQRARMTPEERARDHRVPTVCWECHEPACVCAPAKPKSFWQMILDLKRKKYGAFVPKDDQ